MPKITVEIAWDWPDEPFWLNADNVAIALHAHCKNTRFVVEEHIPPPMPEPPMPIPDPDPPPS